MSNNDASNLARLNEENLSLLMQVISLLPNAVHIKNRAHEWVEVNDAFAKLMGYKREDIIGKTSFDLMPEQEAELSWVQDDEVLRTRGRNRNIKELKNRNGKTFWVEAQKCYFKSAAGNEYVIGVLTDLTALKLREAELMASKEKWKHMTKARATFLANMGSDIKDPMNAISELTRSLKETPLDLYQADVVDQLNRSGRRLFRIIDDIMDYSTMDAGLMKIKRKPFDPNKLVENLATSLGKSARDKKLDLVFAIDPDLPEFLIGDAKRIKQILLNIAENAIKFTQKGFVSISVAGQSKGWENNIVFTVRDSGPGMREEDMRDFLQGQRDVEEQAERAEKSTGVSGLGLSLCRQLASLMGGAIDISTTLGEGTEFKLYLKLRTDPASANKTNVQDLKPLLPQSRILIVDDLRVNYDALQTKLRRLGLTADYAQTARIAARKLAVAHAEGDPYTLVFVDYMMPDVDGLLFVNSITKNRNYSDIELIVLSSVNDPEVESCFTSEGLATYLSKPVRQTKLEKAIRAVAVRETLNAADLDILQSREAS